MRRLLFPALILACCLPTVVRAQDPKAAVTDPAKADADFLVQGEYLGDLKTGDESRKTGAQIIALGGGKFDLVLYQGGLPGEGGKRDDKPNKAGGETKLGKTVFVLPENGGTATAGGGVLTVTDAGNKERGQLKRVERKSPTLGAKPPEGAVVLFDGTTADSFQNGKLSDDGLLIQGVTSKQKFQSCTLHIEFRTPYQPYARDQGRGNSGCYLQGRYEVQVLDSFGLAGKNNEAGGLYSIKDPDLNMCFPPLAWQTYDIDFTAAKYEDGKKAKHAQITVRHNGVVVHQDVELPKSTTAAPVAEGPDPGPLYLQDHGNPVRYRNIWVVEKK